MRASSSSSSSSNSLAATSLTNRLKTIFKKAYELSVLCQIEVCVIHYGPKGELNTWPEEREKVKEMALRYNAATKRKKTLNVHEYLKKKEEEETNLNKKKQKTKRDSENVKYPVWYPVFDHYSPNQLSQLILSLERNLSTLQERLRLVQAQRQRNTNSVHQSLTPASLNQHHHHQYQTQPLNPSQFSLCIYNHGDVTFSQLPLSASHFNQLTSYQNHLMMQQQQQELYGIEHSMTNSNVVQHPCVSSTQDYSALLSIQDSGLKNHLMQQQDLYDSHENMCLMNDITNGKVVQHPRLPHTAPDNSFSGLQKNPYGDLVGRSSFSQDFPDLFSTYDENGLLQASSLHTVPSSYLLSDKSIFL